MVEGRARLWVRDEGPGIPPDDQERIFGRYDARQRARDGTGLGLSIVEAIAEAHGGRVMLDSRQGLGATFTIVIPAEPVAAP